MSFRLFQARWVLLGLLLAVLVPHAAYAHVGSKDVFEQVSAGPYKLFVTVRTPTVIPGVARIEVQSSGAAVDGISVTPVPMTGEAANHPPTADVMARSASDPSFFTGNLWMMATGSWEVRFAVSGASGRYTTAVPVPAAALSTMTMHRSLGLTLGMLGLFLMIGMAGMVAAAVRDARLAPGATAAPALRRRARFASVASLAVMALLVWGGAKWWQVDAADYSAAIYRPLVMHPVLDGNQLQLKVIAYEPKNEERHSRSNDDFLPDHGHLMHLYVIRWPEMDAVFHLHPVLAGKGDFRVVLPAMPEGDYRLYGDVVHRNGFPETLTARIKIPEGMAGAPLGSEDAEGRPQPLDRGMLGSSYTLPDGYVMVWDRPAVVTAHTAYAFRFRLMDAEGKPAADMQPYLGMAGHAAFVKTDGTVFAHTHPEGSAAMAAMMLADKSAGGEAGGSMKMDMADDTAMDMPRHSAPMSNVVEFPYGFPSAGRYRVFIQMKHAGTVETGTFDVMVE
ncbi:MAG: hypothetical protein ABI158_01050 [Edaphobacter sp.]